MIGDHIGKLLIRAISTMDPRYKSILTSYYYNQLSIPDLAKINNASPGYIYKVLTGARQSLREYLKENGICETDYPKSLSLAAELFLSYGEGAVEESETAGKE